MGGGVQKNHPTVGHIPGGAIVERELPLSLAGKQTMSLNLNNPDFTTSLRLATVINRGLGEEIAPDSVTKVVLNERTGTVIMGENVRISTVAVSHGNYERYY